METLPARLILIVDDDPAIMDLTTSILTGEGHSVVTAHSGEAAVRRARAETPDLVLLDVDMGEMDGHATAAALRADEAMREVPILFVTGNTDLESKLRALREGANDYILKPFHREELLARVGVALRIKALQDALRERNNLLAEMAIIDELTGLFNRRYVLQRLREEVPRARRYQLTLSCLMLDLDYFKRVNDTHGHLAGDELLRRFAAILRRSIRSTDVPGRYGGEEFLVILPQTPLSGAHTLAERIRHAVEQTVFLLGEVELSCTISIGVASAPNGDLPDGEWLIGAADEALYRAKRAGRNRVEVARPPGQ